jgi:hypothetical protein
MQACHGARQISGLVPLRQLVQPGLQQQLLLHLQLCQGQQQPARVCQARSVATTAFTSAPESPVTPATKPLFSSRAKLAETCVPWLKVAKNRCALRCCDMTCCIPNHQCRCRSLASAQAVAPSLSACFAGDAARQLCPSMIPGMIPGNVHPHDPVATQGPPSDSPTGPNLHTADAILQPMQTAPAHLHATRQQ